MRARRRRPLSELEGCVLGHLWKRGPSTPYSVRRMFLDSPSSHWSGSAGAVYPLLERLEQRGLVASALARRGGRNARNYSLTRAGLGRLQRWLAPAALDEIVAVPPDPLRTRLGFLRSLPPRERRSFLERAVRALRAGVEVLAAARTRDEDEQQAHAAACHAMRARLEWIERLARSLRRG